MSRRSPLAVLAVLTLVGSLLAVSAVPAVGEDGEADDLANYSACVGPATESAGFDDVTPGGTADAAISCMAYYGIMPGTSEKMFSPWVGVTRREMALFLIRATGPAGIDVPRATDQGFDDIDDLPRPVRDAINQLADLRITKGTTTSTYSPDNIVTRRQMVQYLARFLKVAPVGEGGVDIDDVDPDDDQFYDIEDLPHDPYDAIRALFEMGVTNGTSRTTFSPGDTVTRGQMAKFISRMLAHTNARPAGVTMQSLDTSLTAGDTAEVLISVRDDDHLPMPDVSVDMFYAPSESEAFESNGTCSDDVEAEFGDLRCAIDVADETTDVDGNLPYDLIVDESLVFWAWTGDRGDRFDDDKTDSASLEFTAVKPATHFLLTDDMHPEATKLPFGRRVTFTFQLVDEDQNPVAEKDVEVRLRIRQERDNRQISDRPRTYDTDSSGRFQMNFRFTDPDSRDGDVDSLIDFTLEDVDRDLLIKDESAVKIIDGSGRLQWSDDDDEPTTLLLKQSLSYHPATGEGRGWRHRVTATLLDQYGDPVRKKQIHFTSNDPDGLDHKEGDVDSAQNAYHPSTSSRGTATVSYYRRSAMPFTEIITAFVKVDPLVPPTTLDHHWVEDPPQRISTFGVVLHHDEDRNTVVIKPNTGGPYVVSYDSEDSFNDGNDRERYAEFKKGLKKGNELEVIVDSYDPDYVNFFRRNP